MRIKIDIISEAPISRSFMERLAMIYHEQPALIIMPVATSPVVLRCARKEPRNNLFEIYSLWPTSSRIVSTILNSPFNFRQRNNLS